MAKNWLINSKGENKYLFNWIGGGFNDVWAKNMAEARKKAKKEFSTLKADPKSFRRATVESSDEMDRIGRLMTC